MQAIAYTPTRPNRLSGVFVVIAVHAIAISALLVVTVPSLQQAAGSLLQMQLVQTEEKKEVVAPKPPEPLPMKRVVRPTPVQQPTPVTDTPPILHSTAPADVPQAAAPAPQPPPPPQAATTQAAAAPAPAEVLQPPKHDADHLFNPLPEYPRASRSLGEEGKVLLRVYVSEEGKPVQVLLASSSGFPRLDNAAINVVTNRYRFVPARLGTRAVAGWVTFTVDFSLNK